VSPHKTRNRRDNGGFMKENAKRRTKEVRDGHSQEGRRDFMYRTWHETECLTLSGQYIT